MVLRLGILASGRGTDFQAIVDHVKMDILRGVEIALLVGNNRDAEVIKRAKREGVESLYFEGISGKKFQSKEEREESRVKFDTSIVEELERRHVNLIILAGFNQILSHYIVSKFANRIMNVHPAYDIEKFGGYGMVGMKVHQAVLDAGEKVSGCTVHYVDSTVDRGPIIIRTSVPVLDDDVYSLEERVLDAEHRTYPKAIQLHADNRIRIEGRRVFLDLYSDAWELDWVMRQERFILEEERGKHKRPSV